MVEIRKAASVDHAAIWALLKPVLRAGETYTLPRDWGRDMALGYWLSPDKSTFVAQEGEATLGAYYLRPNQLGPGDHVCNCGYVVSTAAQGRGIARAMCAHSLQTARQQGYRAMQFNAVVSSNARAVKLWRSMGFEIMATLPGAFRHPSLGEIDAFVMFQRL